MINPVEGDIGRVVVWSHDNSKIVLAGVITSFDDKSVYVRYHSESLPVATRRADLEWWLNGAHIFPLPGDQPP